MMRTEAVIFDMDGVLVDTEPYYVRINRAFFDKLGMDLSVEEQMSFVGIDPEGQWSTLKERYGLTYSVPELVARERRDQVSTFSALSVMPPVPGIPELITELAHAGVGLAVGSSSSRAIVNLLLTKSDLGRHFPVTVSGDEVRQAKPEPDIFLRCAGLLGAEPAECIVVEDSPHGITAARKAGMRSIGFANPNSGGQDLAGAELVVDSFDAAERMRILERILGDGRGRAGGGRGKQ